MKRIILEWSMILALGMALALSGLWGYSKFFDRSSYHLRIPTSRSVANDLHVLVGDGDLSLCDQFDVDASGNVRPLIVDSRKVRPADILKGDRFGGFSVPGLDLRYYRMASDGYVIWSLQQSLLIPAAVLFLLASLSHRRLKRLRGRQRVTEQSSC